MKEQTYWPLEYRHTTRGWVETGTVFGNVAAGKRALDRVHPTKRDRYRLGEPKVSRSTGQRLIIRL